MTKRFIVEFVSITERGGKQARIAGFLRHLKQRHFVGKHEYFLDTARQNATYFQTAEDALSALEKLSPRIDRKKCFIRECTGN